MEHIHTAAIFLWEKSSEWEAQMSHCSVSGWKSYKLGNMTNCHINVSLLNTNTEKDNG